MELTTQQIYAFAIFCVVAVILIGIAYCGGLYTGRAAGFEQGRDNATDVLEPRHRQLSAENFDLCCSLDQAAQDLDEARAQVAVLQARPALTDEDRLTLMLAARQLGISAHQFAKSGTTKTNQYALAQAKLQELADRLKTAGAQIQQPNIDTQLIEWLDEHASYYADHETAYLHFAAVTEHEGHQHLRDVLQLAMQQAIEIEQGHDAALRLAVDLDAQAAANSPGALVWRTAEQRADQRVSL